MPSVIQQLSNLVGSLVNAITAVLGSILAVFQSILQAIFGVIQSIFAAVGTMIAGLAHTFEGLLKFLLSEYRYRAAGFLNNQLTRYLGNIVVIGVVIGGLFLYGVYQQRNGRPITAAPAKKTS